MSKRISIENKTYGRYHIIEYAGWDKNKKGCFYICVDMTNGKKKLMRQDLLISIEKNYQILLKELNNITKYKKQHNLK
ncbi:MAG: hypothetical protein LBS76_05125 [Mycoplasmataceae bacterium]|jgi:hypothetical protein|nr:hypothetical protein [Mycoplasmataceae bacterium]